MAHKDRKILAQRIRERRLALGLTQREVAGSDFTRGFISQIENGMIAPSLKSLEIIAQRLGTTVSSFLSDDNAVETSDILSMIRRASSLRDNNELTEALSLAKDAKDLAEKQSDALLQARAQSTLGWVQYKSRQYSDAAASFELASQAYQRAGDLLDAIKSINSAGTSWHLAHDINRAKAAYQTALKWIDDIVEYREEQLRVSVNLALAHFASGDYEQALPLLQQTLERERASSDYYRLGGIYVAIGLIHKKQAQYKEAIMTYEKARHVYAGVSDKIRYAHATLNIGIAYAAKKDFSQARLHLEEALQAYEKLKQPAFAANAHAELAHVAWHEGNIEEADAHCNAALAGLDNGRELGRMHLLHGRILERRPDPAAALEAYSAGLRILDSLQDPEAVEACFALGNLLLRIGRAEDAGAYLARAAASYRDMSK